MSDLKDNFHEIVCEHNDNKTHMQSLTFPCGDCQCAGAHAECKCKDGVNGKGCGCGNITSTFAGNTIVIDDANEISYLYGNVVHENHHKPETVCSPFVAVPTNISTYTKNNYPQGHEVFDGVASDNSITLAHTPDTGWPVIVFKNGLKQVEGDARDYTLKDNEIHFKFYELQPADVVEVYYRYYNQEA